MKSTTESGLLMTDDEQGDYEDTITRLTAELAKSERVAKFWEDELIGSKNAINGLLAELAEAKQDTARLDFLDETDQSFYWPEDQPVRAVIDAAIIETEQLRKS